MKIKFKRSNQVVDGSAKAPTSSQLDYGELATNYSADDPALFIKDSSDNIVRISGNIATGETAPSGASDGNLWYNTAEGRLFVYYTDADSSQWVDTNPGGLGGDNSSGGGSGAVDSVSSTSDALSVAPTTGNVQISIASATTTNEGVVQIATASDVSSGTTGRVVDAYQLKQALDNIDGGGGTPNPGGNSNISSGATAPSNPSNNDLWFNSEEGRLLIWYNDGNSNQWVDAAPNATEADSVRLGNIEATANQAIAETAFNSSAISSNATQISNNAGNIQIINSQIDSINDEIDDIQANGGGGNPGPGGAVSSVKTNDVYSNNAMNITPAAGTGAVKVNVKTAGTSNFGVVKLATTTDVNAGRQGANYMVDASLLKAAIDGVDTGGGDTPSPSSPLGAKVYNAVEWGCDPMGVNDCADAIDSIFDDIITRWSNTSQIPRDYKSLIYFPTGTYILKRPIKQQLGFKYNNGSYAPQNDTQNIAVTLKGDGMTNTEFILHQPIKVKRANGTWANGLTERGGFKINFRRGGSQIVFEDLSVVTEGLNETRSREGDTAYKINGVQQTNDRGNWYFNNINDPVDVDYGIWIQCDDVSYDLNSEKYGDNAFASQEPAAIIRNIQMGWQNQKGGEQEILHPNCQGFFRQALTLIGCYLPIIEYYCFANRVRTYDGNEGFGGQDAIISPDPGVTNGSKASIDAAPKTGDTPQYIYDSTFGFRDPITNEENSYGVCTDNCYGGYFNLVQCNANHHKYGIRDRWFTWDFYDHINNRTTRISRQPSGEGGQLENSYCITRIGLSKRRWLSEPHFCLQSNHWNCSEMCIDFANMSYITISDTFIICGKGAGSVIGCNILNCENVHIDKYGFSYEAFEDISNTRAFKIQGRQIIARNIYGPRSGDYPNSNGYFPSNAGAQAGMPLNKSRRDSHKIYISDYSTGYFYSSTNGVQDPVARVWGECGDYVGLYATNTGGTPAQIKRTHGVEVRENRDFIDYMPPNYLWNAFNNDLPMELSYPNHWQAQSGSLYISRN